MSTDSVPAGPYPETRALSKKKAEIMLAYSEGKAIECLNIASAGANWKTVHSPSWNWSNFDYRINPEASKQVMIRHYLIANEYVGVLTKNFSVREDAYAREIESQSFVRFLDDWHPAAFPPPSTPL
jgi:hypothetical protein